MVSPTTGTFEPRRPRRGWSRPALQEATAVSPEGRITLDDLGLWDDTQIDFLQRINHFIATQGSVPGIQLAHAGRKASTYAPWKGSGAIAVAEGGWSVAVPSAVLFVDNYPRPSMQLASGKWWPTFIAPPSGPAFG